MITRTLNNLPDILTAKDISEFLGISYNSTLKLIKHNMIFLKIGNTYRVTKDHFRNFIEEDTSKAVAINQ